ncbi:hypothetical protein [Roseateles sp. LYH14W]|uniref:DUF3887 domain-containing protein n=1 Tax=Pelomonas parva TaxID=3299032 RepID=A0ABW7EZJ7_9BURK
MKAILAMALAILLTTSALAQTSEQKTRIQEIQRASSIAYLDFCNHLAKEDPTRSEEARFISNISNYEMTISFEGKGKYVVVFSPKIFRGERFFGGVARYEIDANTGSILKFAMMK